MRGPTLETSSAQTLPRDRQSAALASRIWRPDVAGPSVVTIREETAVNRN
jgi:fumarylacetoacetate (FAA) hydrolase family protein